jgi:hypothetical protein
LPECHWVQALSKYKSWGEYGDIIKHLGFSMDAKNISKQLVEKQAAVLSVDVFLQAIKTFGSRDWRSTKQ